MFLSYKGNTLSTSIKFTCFTVMGLAFFFSVYNRLEAAEIEIAPRIESNLHFIDIAETDESTLEDEGVLEFKPSINLSYKGKSFNSDIELSHTYIDYLDSEVDTTNITEAKLNNEISLWAKRLIWDFGYTRSYQPIDSRQTFLNDPIYGEFNFTDSDEFHTGLTFQNLNQKTFRMTAGISANKTDFDVDAEDLTGDDPLYTSLSNGEQLSGNLAIGYSTTAARSYFNLTLNAAKNNRENAEDLNTQRASFNAGVPIWNQFGLALNASHEENDANSNQVDDEAISYDSWGYGLSWRLSSRSYLELTYNKNDRSGDDEFLAYRVNWQPSNRTTLKAEFSRRFYGDAGSIDFSWRGKRFSSSITYNEEVTSTTRVESINDSLGDFVCDIGNIDPNTCFPVGNGNIAFDPLQQDVIELFAADYVLVDQVTLNKQGNINLTYQHKRLSVTLNSSINSRTYLDDDNRQQDTVTLGLLTSLDLSKRNKLKMSIDFRQLDYRGEDRKEDTQSFSTTFDRQINHATTASLNYKVSSQDNSTQGHFLERRLWLGLKYQF